VAVAMCRMYYYNGGKFDSGPCLWLTAAFRNYRPFRSLCEDESCTWSPLELLRATGVNG